MKQGPLARKILSGAAILAALLLLEMAWREPDSLTLTEYTLALDAPALKGLSIAVISDLHAGAPYIDEAKIDQVVARTNEAHPDLVLLAGDYVSDRRDGSLRMDVRTIAGHLAPLRAPLGVYAVLGNHDERIGGSVSAALSGAGIVVLNNAHTVIGRAAGPLVLAGVGDWLTGRADPGRALGGLAGQKAICLTHSPDAFPELPPACLLTVAGHTHGGQVALPLIGRPAVGFASHHGQRFARGIVQDGGRTLFVSSGVGTTFLPLRLGVPPEISLLRIR